MEGEADMTRCSNLNLSVVTVFGHIFTYGTFKTLFYCGWILEFVDCAVVTAPL